MTAIRKRKRKFEKELNDMMRLCVEDAQRAAAKEGCSWVRKTLVSDDMDELKKMLKECDYNCVACGRAYRNSVEITPNGGEKISYNKKADEYRVTVLCKVKM